MLYTANFKVNHGMICSLVWFATFCRLATSCLPHFDMMMPVLTNDEIMYPIGRLGVLMSPMFMYCVCACVFNYSF